MRRPGACLDSLGKERVDTERERERESAIKSDLLIANRLMIDLYIYRFILPVGKLG